MAEIAIVAAEPRHYRDILALNQELVDVLAPMDEETMLSIGGQCDLFSVVEVDGQFAGFFMALREGTAYDGLNYKWFEARYHSFLYIDRMVLSPRFHRMGIGQQVYQYIFNRARACQVSQVTAEINAVPPNHTSLAFHKACGFQEVGTLPVPGKDKIVSMQWVKL